MTPEEKTAMGLHNFRLGLKASGFDENRVEAAVFVMRADGTVRFSECGGLVVDPPLSRKYLRERFGS